MSTSLIPGTFGPWQADDDLAHGDGYALNGQHQSGGITVDGLNASVRHRPIHEEDDVILGKVARQGDGSTA